LAFGVWPDVTLADARAKRDAARQLVACGINPGEKAKQGKGAASTAAANTFEAVANEWLAKSERGGLSAVKLKKIPWFHSFFNSVMAPRPISEVSAHELLSVLHSVEVCDRHETAKWTRYLKLTPCFSIHFTMAG
jgi:Arm DNA-binding domain